MTVKDYFSAQSDDYVRFRPRYPGALFDWLAGECPATRLAWDCGCGSGQATPELARRYDWVVATDPSAAQLSRAPSLGNAEYRCVSAEESGLPDQSVDLVVAAQALHWFDLELFYAEVRRIVRPQGLMAALTYNLLRISPEIDALIDSFYQESLGRYWPAERQHIEDGYRSLPFPFAEVPAPGFPMEDRWSLEHLCGYLNTWSALQLCRRQTGHDPLPQVVEELNTAWGDTPVREVRWPLTVRVGRII